MVSALSVSTGPRLLSDCTYTPPRNSYTMADALEGIGSCAIWVPNAVLKKLNFAAVVCSAVGMRQISLWLPHGGCAAAQAGPPTMQETIVWATIRSKLR